MVKIVTRIVIFTHRFIGRPASTRHLRYFLLLPYKEKVLQNSCAGLVEKNFIHRKICFACCCKRTKRAPRQRSKAKSSSRVTERRSFFFQEQIEVTKKLRDGGGSRFGDGLRWSAGRHQRQATARLGLGAPAKEGKYFACAQQY